MIHHVVGDALLPVHTNKRTVIAHVVNTAGAWGAGFVVPLGRRYPYAKDRYQAWGKGEPANVLDPPFQLGVTQFVNVGAGDRDDIDVVANMCAQLGLPSSDNPQPIRYDALLSCMKFVAGFARGGNYSVHMPRIGCGIAGGEWPMIETILSKSLGLLRVETYVYTLPFEVDYFPEADYEEVSR